MMNNFQTIVLLAFYALQAAGAGQTSSIPLELERSLFGMKQLMEEKQMVKLNKENK